MAIMDLSAHRKCTCFLGVIFCLSNSYHLINGFVPKAWYGNAPLVGGSGTQHDKQTDIAIRFVAAEWFNDNPRSGSLPIPIESNDSPPKAETMFQLYYGNKGSDLLKDFTSAKDTIMNSNAATDSNADTKSNPAFHFDAERFDQSNANVASMKKMIIMNIISENYEDGRRLLGTALHTLQDFYSHSNWIESGATSVKAGIGSYGEYFDVTQGPTCINCSSTPFYNIDDGFSCINNIRVSAGVLTSGYYSDQQDSNNQPIPKPVNSKCSHGGSFDTTRHTPAVGGINKDSDNSLWSPHYYLHNSAVQLSIRATRLFINDIRSVSDNIKFGKFLALIRRKSIAIVMDTTGSMGDYIFAAQVKADSIVDEASQDDGDMVDYILVPFNDPAFGPVFKTQDPEAFKTAINELTADGGGDTPEMCYSGIALAISVAASGSDVFVFTDAPAKDINLRDYVIATAAEAKISIYFFMPIGSAAGRRKKRALPTSLSWVSDYIAVAMQTGGQVFQTTGTVADIFKSTAVIDVLTDYSAVIAVKETNIAMYPASTKTITFGVDSVTSALTVIIGGDVSFVNLTLLSPALVQPTNLNMTYSTFIKIALVSSPSAGLWKLQLNSTAVSLISTPIVDITIVVNSHYDAVCLLLHNDTQSSHSGLQAIKGNPIAGSLAIVQCTSTSRDFVLNSMSMIQSTNTSSILSSAVFTADETADSVYYAQVVIPQYAFYLQLKGLDTKLNLNITRVRATAIKPSFIQLTASLFGGLYVISQGGLLTLTVTITNAGLGDTFYLSTVSSLKSVVVTLSKQNAYIPANSSQTNLTVYCMAHVSTPVGSSATIQVKASTAGGDSSNFVLFSLLVIANVSDTTSPSCKVISDTYNASCKSVIDVTQCQTSTWNADVEFSDNDSKDTLNIVTKAALMNNTLLHFPALVNLTRNNLWKTNYSKTANQLAKFGGHLSIVCCVQTSDFVLINANGLSATCSVGKPRPPPNYLSTNISTDNPTVISTENPTDFSTDGAHYTCQSFVTIYLALIIIISLRSAY